MNTRKTILAIAIAAALAGCKTAPSLIFGQSHSVGISMGGAASDAGAELSVGYKDRDIAVVPVAIVSKNGAVDAQTMPVRSQVASKRGSGVDTDSLSVFGQFQANTQDQSVSLGKFFATGLAAQQLADGFRCQIGGAAACTDHDEKPESDSPTQPPATAAAR